MATSITKRGLNVEVSLDEAELGGYLEELMAASGRFKPAWVVDESEHAMYIEFGTNGAHSGGGGGLKSKGQPSAVELEIRTWVERRFHKTGKERDAVARNVYRKIMREGIPPQPFFRPAVYNVMQQVSSDPQWFSKEDHSILKIAEMIAEEMKRILRENDTPVSGDIIDKISFYEDPGDRPLEVSAGLRNMPQNVLDSTTADLNGNEQRAIEGKKRRIR